MFHNINFQKNLHPSGTGLVYTSIKDIKKGTVSLKGRVSKAFVGKNPKVLQDGTITDETGTIKFVIYQDDCVEALQREKEYAFENVYANDKGQGFYVIIGKRNNSIIKELSAERVEKTNCEKNVHANNSQSDFTPIKNIKQGNISLKGKVCTAFVGKNSKVFQEGTIDDETGTIRFVIYQDNPVDALQRDKKYTFENVYANDKGQGFYIILGKRDNPIIKEIIDENIVDENFEKHKPGICNQSDYTHIKDLKPGFASICGCIWKINPGKSSTIFQNGKIGDKTGSIEFVIYSDNRVGPLKINKWYFLKNVFVHNHGGVLQLVFSKKNNLDFNEIMEIDELVDKTLYSRENARIQVLLNNEINASLLEIFETIQSDFPNNEDKNHNILTLKQCSSVLCGNYLGRKPIPYQCKKMQNVYMLRYFPYFIETIYSILKTLNLSFVSPEFKNDLNVCLYGCGAAPELLGLCSYLRDCHPSTQNIHVSFFDRYCWDEWRNYTINTLASSFWKGEIESEFHDINLFVPMETIADKGKSRISESHIHSIQNVVSDLFYQWKEKFPYEDDLTTNEKIADRIIDLIRLSSQGSIWIISDQHKTMIQKTFLCIAEKVEKCGVGKTVTHPDRCRLYSPKLSGPDSLYEFYQNKDDMGFWPLVIRRT